ncbi:C2 family cysteine protease [Pyxidicoccus trucidator]|uniref:C2 family cysteine protease n=1 Tax=Pyxidicoccus trucidator TaxID=2709662 RepID=UPI0013DB993E|nr:C2 family cysteine protease [Pyxidicoccus trucidator]
MSMKIGGNDGVRVTRSTQESTEVAPTQTSRAEPQAVAKETTPAWVNARSQDGMLPPNRGKQFAAALGGAVEQTSNAEGPKDPKAIKNPNVTGTYGPVPNSSLFEAGADGTKAHWNDVQQGQIGDCYLMTSMGAIARANPAALENMIKGPDKEGAYTVTFHEKDWLGRDKTVDIKVSPEMLLDKNKNPIYAGTPQDNGKAELWPAVIEKAYAQWKGGYKDIVSGNSSDAMEAITGKDSSSFNPDKATLADLDKRLKAGEALTAGTHDDIKFLGIDFKDGTDGAAYKDGRLVADHEYFITGVDTKAGTVTLRNPWGAGTPDVVLTEKEFRESFQYANSNPTK